MKKKYFEQLFKVIQVWNVQYLEEKKNVNQQTVQNVNHPAACIWPKKQTFYQQHQQLWIYKGKEYKQEEWKEVEEKKVKVKKRVAWVK